jgi:hypothetical protein
MRSSSMYLVYCYADFRVYLPVDIIILYYDAYIIFAPNYFNLSMNCWNDFLFNLVRIFPKYSSYNGLISAP